MNYTFKIFPRMTKNSLIPSLEYRPANSAEQRRSRKYLIFLTNKNFLAAETIRSIDFLLLVFLYNMLNIVLCLMFLFIKC